MSRNLQDQFIDDDEEETCPLCVEEFDLNDKCFRPCPCGYQICQFCYHNVKTNMNGLCPACRRPYNDKDIVYKTATAEESQAYKQRQQAKQKKSQAAAQKEKLKAEADHLNRKHLAGLRVVQKNLVYVTGLSPTSQEDQLLQTLRGDQYFGQYGKILKIVVSKAKDPSHPNSVGVYVTYERKEDAATCIAAVNGSKNGDRILRAQFGTTKYCSAFLRGEQCQNRGCMFLHEAGEASESYSRADLSALNAGSTQHEGGRPPPPQSQQPIASASASQPMARQPSGDQPHSPFADRPALPSTASWAAKAPQQPSRNESRSTSGAHESPASSHATPATTQAEPAVQPKPPPLEPTLAEGLLQNTVKQHQQQHQQQQQQLPPPQQQQQPPQQPQQQQQPSPNQSTPLYRTKTVSPLMELLKNFSLDDFRFVFSFNSFSDADLEIVKVYPPLFEKNGGTKRRLRRQREEEQLRIEQEETQQLAQPPSVPAEQPPEDNPGISGSLQLGGEPEERGGQTLGGAIGRPPNQDPSGILDQRFQFGGVASPAGLSDRGLTPQQQHQQMLLNNLGQAGMQQPTHPPGHQRNVSRYSFANETSSASTSIKPVANPGLMKQQSSIMPQQSGFGNQQQQYFGSNVQGPPPGLKTTGTPPVSGGMTFGQGHGFATGGLQYGAGASGRNANEEMMRNLLRGRDAAAAAAAAGSLLGATTTMEQKRDLEFPALPPPSRTTPLSMDDSTAVPATIPSRRSIPPSRQASIQLDDFSASRRSTPPVPPGFEAVAAALNESRRSTPTIPPGFERISAVPGYLLESAEEEGIGGSRPSSRASLRKVGSLTQQQGPVLPALPLRPVTPAKVGSKCGEGGTPTKVGGARDGVITEEVKGDKDVEEYSITKDMAKENEEPDVSPQTPAKGRDGANVDTNTGQEDWSKANATTPTSSHTKVSLQPAAKGQATVQASDARATPVTPSKTEGLKKDEGSRRKHPGKLDITAAVNKPVDSSTKMSAANETSVKVSQQPQRSLSQTSKPESPNVASSSSPIVKTAPRTLRVIQTPKAETPPLQPSTSTTTSNTLPVALTGKILSRKPSVASMIVPGTPSSEQVSMSDNLSLTSTSQSRTSSPPPSSSISAPAAGGKVGSAPVRAKTKSQMKKERQERAKALQLEEKVRVEASTAAAEDTKPVQPLPQQEAIISRKKKTKKEKAAVSKMPSVKNVVPISEGTAPTVSRPSSPPAPTAAAVGAKKPAAAPEAEKPATPTKPAPGPVYGPPPPPASSEPSPPPTPPSTLTAAALLADLKASTPEIQKCLNALFRTPTSAFFKPPGAGPTPADLLNNPRHPTGWASEFLPPLTREDVDGLLEGRLPAVRYGGDSDKDAAAAWWDRGMVTSSGTHLRALTAELEERFLVLERALGNIPSDARWRPTKPQNDMRFPRVDLEGLRRGWEERGVSAMERMVQDGAAMKKGAFLVDEAARYLDEFVMPPATPPPATQGPQGQESKGDGKVGESGFLAGLSLEVLERQLQEVRRMSEEREGQLRKMIKKNRRVLGLG